VNVIVGAADLVGGAAERLASCRDVADEFWLDGFVDEWLAMFRAEDDVEENIGKGLSHDEAPIRARDTDG
jgi:hypothetical protein